MCNQMYTAWYNIMLLLAKYTVICFFFKSTKNFHKANLQEIVTHANLTIYITANHKAIVINANLTIFITASHKAIVMPANLTIFIIHKY